VRDYSAFFLLFFQGGEKGVRFIKTKERVI